MTVLIGFSLQDTENKTKPSGISSEEKISDAEREISAVEGEKDQESPQPLQLPGVFEGLYMCKDGPYVGSFSLKMELRDWPRVTFEAKTWRGSKCEFSFSANGKYEPKYRRMVLELEKYLANSCQNQQSHLTFEGSLTSDFQHFVGTGKGDCPASTVSLHKSRKDDSTVSLDQSGKDEAGKRNNWQCNGCFPKLFKVLTLMGQKECFYVGPNNGFPPGVHKGDGIPLP
eukprot:Skav236785  [mRNA]  locus=scaffold1361:215413:216096:- [translate_table: standard]